MTPLITTVRRQLVRRRRSRAVTAGGVLLLVSAASLVACTSTDDSPQSQAARAFFDAYAAKDAARAAGTTTDPGAARTALSATLSAMSGAKPTFSVGAASVTGEDAQVRYSADWQLPTSDAHWRYDAKVSVHKVGSGWQVQWSPAAVAPGLMAGEHLVLVHQQAPRATLRDRDGKALFTEQDVVTVGIDPTQVKDLDSLATKLAAVKELDSSANEIRDSVRSAAKGTRFVAVITLRKSAYDPIRTRIHDLPGTAFQTSTRTLSPSSGFAAALLGRVGPATADQVAKGRGTVWGTDDVGQGGLQESLNDKLVGSAGFVVQAVDADTGLSRRLAEPLTPKAGTGVTLTLDRTVQDAADAALRGVPLPASIVVTRPSTGEVLAVANSDSAPGDIALTGQYPPGSVFKIVSFISLFQNVAALTPSTPVQCPGTVTVNGQTIHNENSFDKGRIDLARAFAFSCNTSTARTTLDRLPVGDLATTAAQLGLGQKWDLPLEAFSGSIPARATSNELAAEAYGQGRTLVSPLLMAEIVGAAGTGTAVAPSLLKDHAGAKLVPLPSTVTGYMTSVMRGVVTVPGATGRTLKDLPGRVGGKTGTAEYGTDVPPKAHSWFAGTRGDLAFAVFVQGGEFTPHTGVALTHTLLEGIPTS